MKKKQVAVIFDDITEFNVLRPGLEELKKAKIDFDIIVPFDSGYADLPKKTTSFIKKAGYKVLSDIDSKTHYKIILTPYPTVIAIQRMSFDYQIKYRYGALSAKPDPVYHPDHEVQYHGMILFNTFEQELYKACGAETFLIDYWRYKNFHRKKHAGKKNLLFLPTFGDVCCIDNFTDDALSALKKEFNIITKSHHATDSNPLEKDRLARLKQIADVFYGSDYDLKDALEEADFVLSDNSGAIFEALYAGVPVSIFCKDPNSRKLGALDTMQSKLVNAGVIPHTDNPNELLKVINLSKNVAKRQSEARAALFSPPPGKKFDGFSDIIANYLSRDPSKDSRKILHDMLITEYVKNKKTAIEFNDRLEAHRQTVADLENRLNNAEKELNNIISSRSWRLITRLQKIRSKLKGNKK